MKYIISRMKAREWPGVTKCDSLLVHVGKRGLYRTLVVFSKTIQNQIDVKRLSWSVRDVIQINHNTDGIFVLKRPSTHNEGGLGGIFDIIISS